MLNNHHNNIIAESMFIHVFQIVSLKTVKHAIYLENFIIHERVAQIVGCYIIRDILLVLAVL